jgi:magnesium-transporting ATPase (P-type)
MPSPIVKMTPAFWQVPLAELFVQLQAGWDGLSSREAKKRLGKFDPNVIRSDRKTAGFVQFLAKFRNPPVDILLLTSALTALTGDAINFLIIAIIMLLSVALASAQNKPSVS